MALQSITHSVRLSATRNQTLVSAYGVLTLWAIGVCPKNTLHIEGASFMCSSVRFPRVILVNVRSAYFTYGEFVMGEGLFFGQAEIYAIFQIDLRTYRVTFSPNDKGILVSASLMLEMREG